MSRRLGKKLVGIEVMKERGRRRFTLIELLVVMLLMGLIMSLMLPAFNRMIRGNRVDQLASGLKLGLEQAQSHAVTSRRYVAVILPNRMDKWAKMSGGEELNEEDRLLLAARPYCFGGYRLAYVEPAATIDDDTKYDEWNFVGWVQNQEWKNAPDGAMLLSIFQKNKDDGTSTGRGYDYDSMKLGKGISMQISNLNDDDFDDRLKVLKDFKICSSATERNQGNCLIVFSPYGGIFSNQDLRLVIAEAVPNGNAIVYPTADSIGPVNCVVLQINRFTGRVEYYQLPE